MSTHFLAVWPIETPLPRPRLIREAYSQLPEMLRGLDVTITGSWEWHIGPSGHRPRYLVGTVPATGTVDETRAGVVLTMVEDAR